MRFDRALDDYLHSHVTPHLTTFFLIVTAFGSTRGRMVLLGLVVAVLLAWRRLWTLLFTWIAAVAGSALIDWLPKGIFQRPRPHFAHPLLIESSSPVP